MLNSSTNSEEQASSVVACCGSGQADQSLGTSLASSLEQSSAASEVDMLEATLNLKVSLAQELVTGQRPRDRRKNYNQKFSDVVAAFDNLSSREGSTESKNDACSKCGSPNSACGRSSASKGFQVVSALKSLIGIRRRSSCVNLPTD